MKKKSSLILASTIGAMSLLVGCGADTYRYEVSGLVEERQIDQDCPGEDVAMEPIGFSAGRPKPKPRPVSSDTDSDTVEAPPARTQAPRATRTPSSAPTGSQNPTRTQNPTPTRSAPTSRPVNNTKGVKLDKKPAKPVKVPKFLKAALPLSLAGCKEEPELFIRNDDGLFEQDVRRIDYDKCLKGDPFPACTEK